MIQSYIIEFKNSNFTEVINIIFFIEKKDLHYVFISYKRNDLKTG